MPTTGKYQDLSTLPVKYPPHQSDHCPGRLDPSPKSFVAPSPCHFADHISIRHFVFYRPKDVLRCSYAEGRAGRKGLPNVETAVSSHFGATLLTAQPSNTDGGDLLFGRSLIIHRYFAEGFVPLEYLLVRRIFIAPVLLGGAGLDIL